MLKTLRFFYSETWHEKPAYLFMVAASMLLNGTQPFINLILSKYLLEELAGGRRIDVICALIAGIVLGNLLFLCLIHVVKTGIAKIDEWLDGYFYSKLSEKTMTMDYPMTESPEVLGQCRKAQEGMAWYSGGMAGLTGCFQMIVSYAITTAGVITIVAVTSPLLLIVAVFAVVGGSLTVRQTNRVQKIEFERYPKVDRSYSYVLNDMVDVRQGKSIRLYDGVPMMRERLEDILKKIVDIFWYTGTCVGRWNCMGAVVNFFKGICIYGYLGWKLLLGAISIGDFAMLSGSANTLTDSLQGMINQVQELHKKLNFMHEYQKFMEMEGEMEHRDKEFDLWEVPSIEFKNVFFKYPSSENYILKDINITIHPGEHLSVVGLNGAGKTTFIKLLCRLYDVSKGEILVNGINIKEYKYEEYMKILSVVFQDFKMFALSMRENIRLGEWDKEESHANDLNIQKQGMKEPCGKEQGINSPDMERVCELSGLKEKIDSLPAGLDTQIYKQFDENGIEPSGGEMQKLAIARALYKDSPVVILDEPTAALDPIAEYEIYKQFDKLVGGKTAIYISHRLSSCKFCDKIAVFAENTIKEYGTHEELLEKDKGIYAEMFMAQAQYYA